MAMTKRPDGGTDPEDNPQLEGAYGVEPGSTPPEAAQTSGLSDDEPRTSQRFPPTGIVTVIASLLVVIVFIAAAVAIILQISS